jgi:deferrochelatase/peroxidase EfeB
MILEFSKKPPSAKGWYLVKLKEGLNNPQNKKYDVDFCKKKSASDGGSYEMTYWYMDNIAEWARLPNE